MSGKKSSRFRITVAFACNADGSERLPVLYIGKSAQPRCMGKISPQRRGFYYRNNESAWMTAVIFQELVKFHLIKFLLKKSSGLSSGSTRR